MGNCLFRGGGLGSGMGGEQKQAQEGVGDMMVKVVTPNGGIMELYAPITVECITKEFPGHAIFPSRHSQQSPLLHNQHLRAGELYYLLPLDSTCKPVIVKNNNNVDHRMITTPASSPSASSSSSSTTSIMPSTPYRMSFHEYNHGRHGKKMLKKKPSCSEAAHHEVFPRYNHHSTGVWKVRLVINPVHLSEILSQDTRTEALIESVRTVAKCGTAAFSNSFPNNNNNHYSHHQWGQLPSSATHHCPTNRTQHSILT